MQSRFLSVRFHVTDKNDDELRAVGTRSLAIRGIGRPHGLDGTEKSFNNDEAAARFYLSKVFERDTRSAVRSLVPRGRAEVIPDMRLLAIQDSPLTGTRLVRFEQTRSSIPIFGSSVVVELDKNREFVSLDGDVAEIRGVSAVASISVSQALEKIAEKAGVPAISLEGLEAPQLTFYHDDEHDSWHLAYLFKKVSVAPVDFLKSASKRKSHGHGLRSSYRQKHPQLNYVVDAHNGGILLYYSAVPMLDIPSKCCGIDDEGVQQAFWGRQIQDGFEMSDPLRAIKTYDLRLNDLDKTLLPAQPIQNRTNDWQDTNKAAISAHVNAMRVYDFYRSVLMRDGIDDKGMDLVSLVNCTCAEDEQPPQWRNAEWRENKMWYGQEEDNGALRSFSRFLDVIAHELTHGVTQYTSDLVYLGESGALNESFSDIFGIIIKNWYTVGADTDVGSWNWEIGTGLGPSGLPLRDLSNPRRTGDPDHMKNYLNTKEDNGGVHTNSNIHNKAAFNVLVAKDSQGRRLFPAREVAVLYYLCLTRLNSLAAFAKTLQVLLDVTKTFYAGQQNLRSKIDCITEAYSAVGI